jgi:hypothetical protein
MTGPGDWQEIACLVLIAPSRSPKPTKNGQLLTANCQLLKLKTES